MAHFSLTIPDEFLPALDELVAMTQAGSREQWLRNVVGTALVEFQIQKTFGPQIQQQRMALARYWS